ncbi:hypothetical protein BJY01DRAFT_262835 [Aspergillus pseudoustus]|uniref:Glucose-methanol-choline oxidoreductase N-terminal domain-containing protein n=1 Tax=Aspergillus pseudoustus TaxID=1810923 RepID=A0ABR4K6A6_9EURO
MGSVGSLSSLDEFLAQSYDYLIVGGGTAGLVVASRLSANPNVRVGVLEAGNAALDDPNITGNHNRSHHIPRGKVLGGSSAINFMAYGRPSAVDFDDWGPGWSWADLMPYYKKSEKLEMAGLSPTCPVQVEDHGLKGGIHTSLGPWQAPVETPLLAAMDQTSGLPRPREPWSGDHLGFHRCLFTVDRTGLPQRSYSVNGYLQPVLGQANLCVLTNALAEKILLNEQQRAYGVDFLFQNTRYQVSVKREVVLCAGTLESPKLLELSGIGSPSHLASLGIPCRIPLPSVGGNLQEKPVSAVVYELADGVLSLDSIIRDKQLFEEHIRLLQSEHTGGLSGAISLMGFLPYGTQVPADQLNKTIASIRDQQPSFSEDETASIYRRQYQQTAAHLQDSRSSDIQLVALPTAFGIDRAYQDCSKLSPGPPPGRNACYSLMVSSMYPVSRGSAHAQSRDVTVPPRVDLGFLTHEADVDVLAAAVTAADKIFQSPPMRDQVKSRLLPPPTVDLGAPDEARDYVRDKVMSYHHAVGTCALGSVVDGNLLVKNTRGLRVVDASVMPAQVSHAILGTVYAIAEKAVDLIEAHHAGA